MTLQQQKKSVEKKKLVSQVQPARGGGGGGGGGGSSSSSSSIGGQGTDCELARSARFRDLISLGLVTASVLLRDGCAVSLMTIAV